MTRSARVIDKTPLHRNVGDGSTRMRNAIPPRATAVRQGTSSRAAYPETQSYGSSPRLNERSTEDGAYEPRRRRSSNRQTVEQHYEEALQWETRPRRAFPFRFVFLLLLVMVGVVALVTGVRWSAGAISDTYNRVQYGQDPLNKQIVYLHFTWKLKNGQPEADDVHHPSTILAINLRGQLIVEVFLAGTGESVLELVGPTDYSESGLRNVPSISTESDPTTHAGLPQIIITWGSQRWMIENTGTTLAGHRP